MAVKHDVAESYNFLNSKVDRGFSSDSARHTRSIWIKKALIARFCSGTNANTLISNTFFSIKLKLDSQVSSEDTQ